MDSDGGIGKNGSLPWPKHSEDLQWFKQATLGHIVVMGGKTWRDPLMPKPLPGRLNAVVSTSAVELPGVMNLGADFRQVISKMAKSNQNRHVFVIGGATIINQCQDLFDQVLLTKFKTSYDCDVFIDIDTILKGFELSTKHNTETAEYTIWNRFT